MFRYPTYIFYIKCVQGFGILFRSVKFLVFFYKKYIFFFISALLRDLQKMTASKPIS